jgi:hypothetical protein
MVHSLPILTLNNIKRYCDIVRYVEIREVSGIKCSKALSFSAIW